MTYLRRKERRILYGFPKGEGVGDAGIFLCEIGRGKELLFMSLMEGEERVKEPCWRLFFCFASARAREIFPKSECVWKNASFWIFHQGDTDKGFCSY